MDLEVPQALEFSPCPPLPGGQTTTKGLVGALGAQATIRGLVEALGARETTSDRMLGTGPLGETGHASTDKSGETLIPSTVI